MLSNPANSTGFADRPRRTQDSKGNRTVSSPDTATFWEQAQVRPWCFGDFAMGSNSFVVQSTTMGGEETPQILPPSWACATCHKGPSSGVPQQNRLREVSHSRTGHSGLPLRNKESSEDRWHCSPGRCLDEVRRILEKETLESLASNELCNWGHLSACFARRPCKLNLWCASRAGVH